MRGPLLALLVVLNLALVAARRGSWPARLHPLLPALTRVAATGGRPLAPAADEPHPGARLALAVAVLQRGPRPDPARAGRLAALPAAVEAHRQRGLALRRALQRDAAEMARILGARRTRYAAEHRSGLASVAEDRAWDAAMSAAATGSP